MKFSATALLTAVLASTAAAAPATSEVKSMSTAATWTITDFKRVCNEADTSCDWSFGIKDADKITKCAYTVKKTGDAPASRTSQTGVACGAYSVTSAWSGQFGEGQGFTTLSVVDYAAKTIAWPAYTDNQLAAGTVVKPDQSYPVQALP
ncbi:hypothetical protein GMORB2_2713 [Geosmithia morbida]|uniref:Small secreted protein n=1 Tax=Geosmithia morbida TaxID=1094350 RepID=A0A9P5D3P2_9HYPO|nr:uncharacterized protein GMORB2_2713 [Geosmithia morbida]KAF4120709.1 hypothetical protein GMORB2_2713 [Geosmithia morbida]